MPIIERTPRACFERFRKHVASLVADTLPTNVPMIVLAQDDRGELSFVQNGVPTTVPLETSLGRLHLQILQSLYAEKHGRKDYLLRTVAYGYRLQEEPGRANALLRWEYAGDLLPDRDDYCRHHIHVGATVPVNGGQLRLNALHIPSGWITIEELIRFVIKELGVKPPCKEAWPKRLAESERDFREKFSGRYLRR